MHAVIVKVNVSDPERTLAVLREQTVPRVTQEAGFVTGYWTRKGSSGVSMMMFDSEDAANSMAEQVASMIPEGVQLEEADVREVVAQA